MSAKSDTRNEEFDWIFDYVLQFLESDKFDAAVMDFVDENCYVFDSEDENKFIYSDIHAEFHDHIEALISSNLGELGITTEMFYDSCEKGRNGRDVNQAVFERMLAMDDFLTFKKIMVKRNMELQLESFKAFSLGAHFDDDDDDDAYLNSCGMIDGKYYNDDDDMMNICDEEILKEMQELLHNSLMEMELMHKQVELEQAELEKAVAMSLFIEGERLRVLSEIDNREDQEFSMTPYSLCISGNMASNFKIESKDEPSESKSVQNSSSSSTKETHNETVSEPVNSSTPKKEGINVASNKDDSPIIDNTTSPEEKGKESKSRPKQKIATSPNTFDASAFADPKPLKLGSLSSKPLPSISRQPLGSIGSGPVSNESLNILNIELENKKKQAEETIKQSKDQIKEQKKKEEELRKKINMGPEEAEKRAQHMREQRDRLIAMKKAERERKVQIEEERQLKTDSEKKEKVIEAVHRVEENQAMRESKNDESPSKVPVVSQEEVDRRRTVMRQALARRMKIDLVESEDAKFDRLEMDQFADLDRKLQQVEQLRNDTRQRDLLLSEQFKKQQLKLKNKN